MKEILLLVLIIVLFAFGTVVQRGLSKIATELNVICATCVQQPQSRHYFAKYDSLKTEWVLDSSVIKK
jgi:hypothetical protein